MALYRQNSTGFLCEFASNPGAGYTAITAQPTDTVTNRVNWWRELDTYGQTSTWHPSLQPTTSYPDDVGPPGLSGSGVNIAPARYQSFEEDGLPPLSTVSATVAQYPSGFHGASCLRIIAATSNAEVWYSASKTTDKNVKLTPNSRWIVSAYLATPTSVVRTCYLQLYTATNTYLVPVATSGVAGQFTRVSGVFDLRGDSSATGTLGIKLAASGADVLVDSNMLEAQIGSGTDPSEYSGVDSAIDGSQVEDATLVVEKLKSGTITGETIILGGSGSIIKSSNYVAGSSGWSIDGAGSAEFRNVTVRGNLDASNLQAGTISALRFGNDTISTGPIIANSVTYSNAVKATVNVANTSGTQTQIGTITVPASSYRGPIFVIGTVAFNDFFSYWVDSGSGVLLPQWFGITLAKGGVGQAQSNNTYTPPSGFSIKPGMTTAFYDPSPGGGAVTYQLYCGHYSYPQTTKSVDYSIAVFELKR